MSGDDLVLIARYFYVKHDPSFDTRGDTVVDAEGEAVIVGYDEQDAKAIAAALNRLTEQFG